MHIFPPDFYLACYFLSRLSLPGLCIYNLQGAQCSVYSRLLSVSWELRMAATATAPDPNEIAPKTDCWTILPNLTNFKLKWIMQTICFSVCNENRTLSATQQRLERLSWVHTKQVRVDGTRASSNRFDLVWTELMEASRIDCKTHPTCLRNNLCTHECRKYLRCGH